MWVSWKKKSSTFDISFNIFFVKVEKSHTGSAHSVMVIIIRIGSGDLSSNLQWGCLHFRANTLGKKYDFNYSIPCYG